MAHMLFSIDSQTQVRFIDDSLYSSSWLQAIYLKRRKI